MNKSKKNKAKNKQSAEKTKDIQEQEAVAKDTPIHIENEETKSIKSVVIPESSKDDSETGGQSEPIISGEIPESDEVIAIPSEIPYVPDELELPELPNITEDKAQPALPSLPTDEIADIEPKQAPQEEKPLEEAKSLKSEKSKKKRFSDQLSDDEAFELLGPESTFRQLTELLLGMVPVISALACFLWITLGGTLFSVYVIAVPGAAVLALFLFWALGGCKNVNRRRFARAYFLWLLCLAAIGAVIALLAYAFGAELSPIIRKIMNIISSVK